MSRTVPYLVKVPTFPTNELLKTHFYGIQQKDMAYTETEIPSGATNDSFSESKLHWPCLYLKQTAISDSTKDGPYLSATSKIVDTPLPIQFF